MITIKLTNDGVALIDEYDEELLRQYSWYWVDFLGTGTKYAYAWSRISERPVAMHRLILKLVPHDGKQVDHINGNGLDNRRCNLRLCTTQENHRNMTKQRGVYSSQYKGVSYREDRKKWQAYIIVDNKKRSLGTFAEEREAAKAYDEAANSLFGEFAYLNLGRNG